MKRTIIYFLGLLTVLLAAMSTSAQSVKVQIPDTTAKFHEYVEVPIHIEGAQNLTKVQLTVEYDAGVLQWKAGDVSKGDLTAGFSLNATDGGSEDKVHITMESPNAVTGSGTLATIKFWVWCDLGTSVSITVDSVLLNDDEKIAIDVEDGQFDVHYDVSGTILYYQGDRPIPQVNLQLTPRTGRVFNGTTESTGSFFVSVPGGFYQVEATKSDDIVGLSAYDASLVLRAVSGDLDLSEKQEIAADVDGDGQIDQTDADLILRHVAGETAASFPAGPWTFMTKNSTRSQSRSIFFDLTNLDMTGVLTGDVSGNWGEVDAKESDAGFSLDQITSQVGADFHLPLRVDTAGKDLYAAEVFVAYDTSKLQFTAMDVGPLADGSLVRVNHEAGGSRIVLAADKPLKGNGILVEFFGTVLSSTEETIPVQLKDVKFNEAVAENLENGAVTLSPHASLKIDPEDIAAATLVKDGPQVFWGDPYLGISEQSETGVYVGFPTLTEDDTLGSFALPTETHIVSAMLMWKFNGGDGLENELPDKEVAIAVRRITDPDNLGAPALSNRSGQKTGLSYLMRDDRTGVEIPWTQAEGSNIQSALRPGDIHHEDTAYIRVNPKVVGDRWVVVEMKDVVEAWLRGTEPGQGVYVQLDDQVTSEERLWMDDLTLVVYYTIGTVSELAEVTVTQVVPGDGKVTLQWSPVEPGVQGVRIMRTQGIPIVSPYDPNASDMDTVHGESFVDDELVNGEVYYYGLVTYDHNQNLSPMVVQRVIPGTLLPPDDLQAIGRWAAAELSWTPVSGADGYHVYRQADGEREFTRQTKDPVGQSAAGQIVWTDGSVADGRTYDYYVVTVNAHGEGPASDVVSVAVSGTPGTKPQAPTIVDVTAGLRSVHLQWEDNSDNELQFQVWYSQDGVNWTAVEPPVSANVTEYTVRGLEPAQQYYFRVRAWNEAGEADSDSEQVQTLNGPTNVKWQQISPGSIDVSWDIPQFQVKDVTVVLYKNDVAIEEVSVPPSVGTVRLNRLEAGQGYGLEVVFTDFGDNVMKSRVDHVVTTDYLIKGPGM